MPRMPAAQSTRRCLLGLGQPGRLEREGDVVVDGHVRVERVALEDHRDLAGARRQVGHHPPADEDVAARSAAPARRSCAAGSSCRSRRAPAAPGTRRPRRPGRCRRRRRRHRTACSGRGLRRRPWLDETARRSDGVDGVDRSRDVAVERDVQFSWHRSAISSGPSCRLRSYLPTRRLPSTLRRPSALRPATSRRWR